LVNVATRKSSLLDLFITNNGLTAQNVSVFNPLISDHSAVSAILSFPRPSYGTKTITYRNFKSTNFGNLAKDILQLTLDSIPDSLSNLIRLFCSSLVNIFDLHAPVLSKTFTEHPKKKYISQETRQLMTKRDLAYKLHSSTQLDADLLELDSLKRQVKHALSADTKDHLNNIITDKGVYAAINSITKLNKGIDSKFNFKVNVINDFFVSVSTSLSEPSSLSFPPQPLKHSHP
jgi:hypothetical protein